MSRDYTGNGLSAANLDSYSRVLYFVGGAIVRNASLDIEETDWSAAAQCSEWTQDQWSNFSFVYEACGDLRPNSDIAGIGVVLAFMITALITIIACFFRGLCLARIAISKDDVNNVPEWIAHRMLNPDFWWSAKKSTSRARFWDPILAKLIIGLADQQMVTGIAVLLSGSHTYADTVTATSAPVTAYHYYVVIHTAAFALVTQSMAILVTLDIIHESLLLHSIRVAVYTGSLFWFYYAAWFSYNLTGTEGYRAACPAHCNFTTYSSTWAIIVILGAPVYCYILADLTQRWYFNLRGKTILSRESNAITKLFDRYGMRVGAVFGWALCVADLIIGFMSFLQSWLIQSYSGLILTTDFDENAWMFGQLVAMIFIALPFLTAFEEFLDRAAEIRKEKMEKDEAAGKGREANEVLLRDTGISDSPYINSLNDDNDIYMSKVVGVRQKAGEWSASNITVREIPDDYETQARPHKIQRKAAPSEPARPILPGRFGYHRQDSYVLEQ